MDKYNNIGSEKLEHYRKPDKFRATIGTFRGACCCTGKQNGEPLCPCDMRRTGAYKHGDEWVIPERRIKDNG